MPVNCGRLLSAEIKCGEKILMLCLKLDLISKELGRF